MGQTLEPQAFLERHAKTWYGFTMSGTKHHITGLGKGPAVDPYSVRMEAPEANQDRVYSFAQLRTAMKHLIPENARLKKRVEVLEGELRRLSRTETKLRDRLREIENSNPAGSQLLIRRGESEPAVT